MELIEINGINILFPYKPYDIQMDYMKSVINCLQKVFILRLNSIKFILSLY
jgi:hypothetical protein